MLKLFGRRSRVGSGEPDWFAQVAESLSYLLEADGTLAIYCIANSEEVPLREIESRIDRKKDLLCQYNKCDHIEQLRPLGVGSIFVFHMTDRNRRVVGCDADGLPTVKLYHHPNSRSCFLLPAQDGMYHSNLDRDFLSDLPNATAPAFRLEAGPLRRLFYAPQQLSTPSAGFASVLLFHLINLRRQVTGRAPHSIVLCGFSGHYIGGGDPGHDFHFEQQELRKLPNIAFLSAGAEREAPPTRLHRDLATIFHPAYNRNSRAKMLLDIARLHFAAGDRPSFLNFLKRSMALNPKGTQVQWVMRALQTMTGGDALEFDRLVGELDALWERWNTGFVEDGLGGAAWPDDIQHSQASYSIRPRGRPRVLVVNETSKLPNNHWHLGCHLVSCRLRQSIDAIGAECVGWANDLAGVNQILRRDPTAQFEGVIINGEGTLHHDADRAFEIGLIGDFFRERGKKVFLINSVWEENSGRLEELVKGFDLIAVRDSRSKANLRRLRDDVRVVPDLCWLDEEQGGEAGDVPCAILDSVIPETSEMLGAVAATTELPNFVMSRFFEAFNRAISNGQPAASIPRVLQKPDITRYQCWLGGRFHGAVLALGAGVPALCLASNTTKIEGMLDDIGLERKLLEVDALDRLKTVPDVQSLFAGPRGYTESDWAKVRAYKAAARPAADAMFADIANALG